MDAIEVKYTETVVTTTRVFLHEGRLAQLKNRFGDGPYSSEQLAEYLEDDQVIYFDEDEAEIVELTVSDRQIDNAKVVNT